MIESIGMNAGLVWNALNEGGRMDVKSIKKATKIKTDKELYAAFGWLAKENKIAFEESMVDPEYNKFFSINESDFKKLKKCRK